MKKKGNKYKELGFVEYVAVRFHEFSIVKVEFRIPNRVSLNLSGIINHNYAINTDQTARAEGLSVKITWYLYD